MSQGNTRGLRGRVDSNNSTNTPLGVSGTFTGTSSDISMYASIVVSVFADQAGELQMQFSTDGVNWDILNYQVRASILETHRLTITRQYFRIIYLNGTIAQTQFRLQILVGSQPQLTRGLTTTVEQDDDSIIVRSIDSEIDIANGRYVGYSIINKAGRNPDVDTGSVPQDVWSLGGIYTGFPVTAGETITVVSTSASDAAAGVGARTIRIFGLDANYNTQEETITLNGVTPVAGVLIFTRVHTAFVVTSGVSNIAFNVGTITIRHTTTVANVFLTLLPGFNQSNCSAYTIPAGFTGYIKSITANVESGTSSATSAVDYSLFIQDALKTTAPRLRRPSSTYYGFSTTDKIFGGLPIPEKTDIVIRVTAVSNNNTVISVTYDVLLVMN